jgi:hypothetical protein
LSASGFLVFPAAIFQNLPYDVGRSPRHNAGITTRITFTGVNPASAPPKRVCIDAMTAAEIDKLFADALKR